MKKTGIRVFLGLVLMVVIMLGTTIPAAAAPPQKATVEITGFDLNQPTFNNTMHSEFSWADKKATHYRVTVTRWTTIGGGNVYTFYETQFPLTSNPQPFNLQHSFILPTWTYQIEIVLLVQKKNGDFREIKHSYTADTMAFESP